MHVYSCSKSNTQDCRHAYYFGIQVVQAGITWKECAQLPVGLSGGRSSIINGKVYCGGGACVNYSDKYVVYCYNPSQDDWTTLPPLHVRYFSLGQVNGQIVAIGGKKNNDSRSNEVYTYDERSKKWKQTIPPMPTAKSSPGVLSLQSALVVAGGATSSKEYTAVVEIFKPDTSQWYTTDPLLTACCHASLVAIGNTYYALGGFKHPSNLNQVLCASVDDLLRNAIPASQATPSDSGDTRSVWKTLPDTPTYAPTATMLAGQLLTVGGMETSRGGTDKKEVYMYSPSANSWIYISDLPAPRSGTAVAVLSSTEILVIGGWSDGRLRTVYKGTLHLNS